MHKMASFCKICGSGDISIIYNAPIRNGRLGQYTEYAIPMFQCKKCKVIWHDQIKERKLDEYYESEEYRKIMGEEPSAAEFNAIHDGGVLDKLSYTGTGIFRDKIVADIGCGAGGFLDFINGVASEVLAIEPTKAYRDEMSVKSGFSCFAYMEDAINRGFKGKVDVLTSFDVIEHVEDPYDFLDQAYELLDKSGRAIIGTPTDAPIMRELLGECYEKQQLFSTQHLWILSEHSIYFMAEKIGFSSVEFKYFQRYPIGNMLGWIRDKKPRSEIIGEVYTGDLDAVWRKELEDKKLSDYIVAYLTK